MRAKRELKSRKQIAFDLKQDALKVHYPKPKIDTNPQYHNKAYRDLEKFFEGENWEHRQGSVYISKEILTDFEVTELIERIAAEMTWLFGCADEIDITDIGERLSLKQDLEIATEALTADEPAMPNP